MSPLQNLLVRIINHNGRWYHNGQLSGSPGNYLLMSPSGHPPFSPNLEWENGVLTAWKERGLKFSPPQTRASVWSGNGGHFSVAQGSWAVGCASPGQKKTVVLLIGLDRCYSAYPIIWGESHRALHCNRLIVFRHGPYRAVQISGMGLCINDAQFFNL